MKSERNKTIDFVPEKDDIYLSRCLTEESLGENPTDSIVLGDAIRVLSRLPAQSVDLLIADPPYNLTKDFGGMTFSKTSAERYRAYTEAWLSAALPCLRPTASVYVCCDWASGLIIADVLNDRLTVRNRITWQREKGRGAAANWKNGMEDVYFATVGETYTFNLDAVKLRRRVIAPYRENGKAKDWYTVGGAHYRDTCPSNFWDDISIPYWSMPENTAHPTQKPEKLLAKLILASSNENDLVLDPFCGSGTTAVTAKKLSRHYLGIECNPTYCAWAQYRLAQADTDRSIQGYTDGVFWERNTAAAQKRRGKPVDIPEKP